VLTVELGLLVVIFGRHYKAAWRSHTQMIVIGLSTVAVALLAIQGAVQYIIKTAHPQSRADVQSILDLITKLSNANKVVYIAALLWWIVWLWLDEPGAARMETAESTIQAEPPQAAK
jgi:hypothetical protein